MNMRSAACARSALIPCRSIRASGTSFPFFIRVNVFRSIATGARSRALNKPVAGKNGTTNDSADTWFMGFTRDVLTGVWVGNADNLSGQAMNAIITFGIYPIEIFPGGVQWLLYTLIPGAFVGSLPAGLIADAVGALTAVWICLLLLG